MTGNKGKPRYLKLPRNPIEGERLSGVKIQPLKERVRFIAGVDCAYDGDKVLCAAVVWDKEKSEVVCQKVVREKVRFPYVPGFLYLREGPSMVKALNRLRITPEVVLVDGQGILHPKKMGLACYVGVKTGIPTVGVAKSRLVGVHAEPGKSKGSYVPVEVEGEVRGALVVTRDGVKGVYVSPGHLSDVFSALKIVLECSMFRIPEPIRQAHILANSRKRA